MARPSCYSLLDDHARKCLALYSTFGFVGLMISEILAYVELLEAEIAEREGRE